MPQEDFIVTGTASENVLETVVKYFMLLSKNVLLGWCPVWLWTDCSSRPSIVENFACFTVGSYLLEMRCSSPLVRC